MPERTFKMKRLIAILLAVCTLTALFSACGGKDNGVTTTIPPLTAPVGEQVEGDYTYVVENNAAKIVKYSGKGEGKVDIPERLGGYQVTVIGANAFEGAFAEGGKTNNVYFPSSLRVIEEKAFYASNIRRAFLEQSNITAIGEQAFANCKNLVQVDFSHTLEEIGMDAFYLCPYLKLVVFRNNEVKMEHNSFDTGASCKDVKFKCNKEAKKIIEYADFHGFTISHFE